MGIGWNLYMTSSSTPFSVLAVKCIYSNNYVYFIFSIEPKKMFIFSWKTYIDMYWVLYHYSVRCALDAEILKYVGEAYPKGICSVYCSKGKDVEGPGTDFELVVVISAARNSPQNFWSVKSVVITSFLLPCCSIRLENMFTVTAGCAASCHEPFALHFEVNSS